MNFKSIFVDFAWRRIGVKTLNCITLTITATQEIFLQVNNA